MKHTDVLSCLEIEAEPDPASAAVIWLHGLGASGHDFEDVVPLFDLPHVRFVLPHAPKRCVTINGGLLMPAWYDIVHMAGHGEDASDVRESEGDIRALVAREQARGVEPDRIVLAGFSQGGAMALHCGLRHPQSLAGIVVLSGYEVLAETRAAEASEANSHTPILFGHGLFDMVVPVERGEAARRAVAGNDRAVAWHTYPIGHQVCVEEIEQVGKWLRARLPDARTPAADGVP